MEWIIPREGVRRQANGCNRQLPGYTMYVYSVMGTYSVCRVRVGEGELHVYSDSGGHC